MLKTLVSLLLALAILVGGEIFESFFVEKQFNEFTVALESLYEKADEKEITKEDVLAVQKNWIEKKHVLHIFIPHNEIKEVDLWLSEAATLVRDKEWHDAISKIEVLKELCEQIPKTFKVSIANVF